MYILLILKTFIFLFKYVYMWVTGSSDCTRDVRFRVTGSCEPPDVHAGNQTRDAARAIGAFNHEAIFPVFECPFLKI